MSAYKRDVTDQCYGAGCHRPAKYEVCGSRNQSYGKFCRECADRKVEEINARERRAATGES